MTDPTKRAEEVTVDRYDLDPKGLCDGDGGRCYAEMGITLTGDYVLYADFLKALQAEYRRGVEAMKQEAILAVLKEWGTDLRLEHRIQDNAARLLSKSEEVK